jgi:RNA ligase
VFQKPKNENYCATVVQLDSFVSLEKGDGGRLPCDNVKGALIFGQHVIVGRDTEPGSIGLFFPPETALSTEFIAANNLYRKPEFGNADPQAKGGYFEQHGRVRTVKFRGHKSEGFWIPLSCLSYLGAAISVSVGDTFDVIGDHEICSKYVPKTNSRPDGGMRQPRIARVEDRLVDGQFRFHPDTAQLRRNLHKIEPDTIVTITDKWHGTSAVFGNLLVKRKLGILERIAKWFGVRVQENDYGLVWSSRNIIKGIGGNARPDAAHFYDADIWGIVAHEIKDRIPKGFTIYGEIVGFTPNGSPIQRGYHYGCPANQHRFLVYRVTFTNPGGHVVELPWRQMQEFCSRNGLETVKELYHGTAIAIHGATLMEQQDDWQSSFAEKIQSLFVRDQTCHYNNNEVPAEGIVLRIDRYDEAEAFKLKNFAFLKRETESLDAGELDIETAESLPDSEVAA